MKKFTQKPSGSILVWTVALGMIMTSVFLFMAIRLSKTNGLKRETLDFLQQKAYAQSYVGYLKQLETQELEGVRDSESGIDYDGITGVLTNEVEEIKGYLDHGQSITLPIDGGRIIEWNECVQGILKEQGELVSSPDFSSHFVDGCSDDPPDSYDQTGIVHGNDTFTLTSIGEPTHYRITSNGSFFSDQWNLNVEVKLEGGRVLRLKERWKAEYNEDN